MLDLPKSTEFNKRIPKQKFYDKLSVTAELKRVFTEQINQIYWKYKIAPSTLNISKGETVTELEVLEIKLNQQSIDKRVLQLIDKEIPYHILYLLEYKGLYQAWIGYKELSRTKADTFIVNSYYNTEWLSLEKLHLRLEGLDVDAIYDGFIRQIAKERLEVGHTESLKEAIDRDDKRQKLGKQIAALENKVYKEKQLNIQMKLNAELKLLKKELEGLF